MRAGSESAPDKDDHRVSSASQREALVEAIAKEEARLARLESEQTEARAGIAALRAQLVSLGPERKLPSPLPVLPNVAVPQTPTEKVKLFLKLFRGREDVYPTRFVSKKTGKPGYAPACANKFVRGLCELPKVKCGECSNQAFHPADAAAVLARDDT